MLFNTMLHNPERGATQTSDTSHDVRLSTMQKDSISTPASNLQKEIRSVIEDLFDHVALLAKACGETMGADHLASPAVDADTAERDLFVRVLAIGKMFMDLFLCHLMENTRLPRQASWAGGSFECKIERGREYRSVFGTHEVQRQLFYGEDKRVVPIAQAGNLPERRDSYFLQELLLRFCIDGTYQVGTDTIADYFNASFSTGSVDDVIIDQARHSESLYESMPVVDPESEGEFIFLQCDGKGVNLKNREGKKESLVGCIGSVDAHVRDPARLAKGLIYPSLLEDSKPQESPPRMKNAQYFGSLEMSKEEFFDYVEPFVKERIASSSNPLIVLMDGCHKLWDLAEERFEGAVRILDIIHVSEYLWDAAKAFRKSPKDDVRITVTAWLTVILEGDVGKVIGYLKQRLTKSKRLAKAKRADVQKAITYFENHRHLMKYNEYLEKGYPIATGVIESACKHIVQNRLEKAGAKWSKKGAEAMIKMRCIRANGDWAAYQQYRKRKEKERLYPIDLAS